MTRDDAKQRLQELSTAIGVAAQILRPHLPLIEQYMREKEHMASVGPIIDPTLFKNSERRAVEAIMTPLYEAVQRFVRTYDAQTTRASKALAEVKHG